MQRDAPSLVGIEMASEFGPELIQTPPQDSMKRWWPSVRRQLQLKWDYEAQSRLRSYFTAQSGYQCPSLSRASARESHTSRGVMLTTISNPSLMAAPKGESGRMISWFGKSLRLSVMAISRERR